MIDRPLVGRPGELASGIRFGRFASVGAVGAVADNAVLLTLVSIGAVPELAKLAGAETAIVLMFLVNERWTFAGEGVGGAGPLVRRFLTSNLVRVGGVVVATVVFSLLVRTVDASLPIAGVDLWFLAANMVGIGCGVVVNYVAEGLFTWRVGVD